MIRHWIWLILSVTVMTVALSEFAHTVTTHEWDPVTLIFGPLCALIWAPTANKHYEAIWNHVLHERGDDDPSDR